MTISINAVLVGKVKTAAVEKQSGSDTYHSVAITTTESWYDRAKKARKYVPVTIFVNIYGKLSDPAKNIINTPGSPIVMTVYDYERTVATNDKGEPMRYTSGDRSGDFMYNINARASGNDIFLLPKPADNEAAIPAPTPAAEAPAESGPKPKWL